VNGYVGSLSDASKHVRSAAQHHALEALFTTVADAIPGYIFQRLVRDGQSSYPYISASFTRLIGLPDGTRITAEILDRHFHPEDATRIARELSHADLGNTDQRLEFRLVRVDGEVVWVRSLARARVGHSGEVIWTGVAVDISGEKSVEQNLSHLHMHDTLTGLLNRAAFQRAIFDLVCQARTDHTDCAVLDIDLVSFDEINDVFGRLIGDRMLQEIAGRLERLAGNEGLVARLDGDSFGMVVSDFAGREEITRLTNAVTQELARPFTIDDQRLKVQSIVGAAILSQIDPAHSPDPGQTAEELIKRAGVARHEARLSRSNVSAIYAPEIDSRVRKRARLRQSLHRAIDAEEFELYYQPIVHLRTGDICGAEALIRWNEPSLGLQRPDEFIPLAEESGLIIPLGAWALKSAVRELKRWDEPGNIKPRIAVNVSGVQLQERDFVATVKHIITQGEIEPQQIELELTESFLIHESGRLSDTLQELKNLGITIAIDDFGTGYSSFQYLRELPATKVKIDQSFIRNLDVGSSDASIVRAMITMAVNLGLDVVVEGVETAEQREFLIGEGCGLAQGYLFSVPLKAEDFFWTFESRAVLPLELTPIGGAQTLPSRLAIARPSGLIGFAPA
jgi:diguanylate cyclase (GGDEF)-like protein/PAS domain S-box-containing protein